MATVSIEISSIDPLLDIIDLERYVEITTSINMRTLLGKSVRYYVYNNNSIQFKYLFTCKLNSPEASYEMSTNKTKKTNKKQKKRLKQNIKQGTSHTTTATTTTTTVVVVVGASVAV
jgi:menaquinone-dependent protoporphyrinogen IX oxidase